MAMALYNNPRTLAREVYQDGELLASDDSAGSLGCPPWVPGELTGDIEALPDALRAVVESKF